MPGDGLVSGVKRFCSRSWSLATAPFKWTWRQAAGFGSNASELVDAPGDVVPESVREKINQILGLIPLAFGTGTAQEQVVASVVLGSAAYVSSLVTFGATLVLVGLFSLTGLVGVLRMVPAIGDTFDNARDSVSNGGGEWTRRRR